MVVGGHCHTLWPWIALRGPLKEDGDIGNGGDGIRGRKSRDAENHDLRSTHLGMAGADE